MTRSSVPPLRIRECNAAPVRAQGDYVLYWMIAYRRSTWNFSFDRAIEWAEKLRKPLLVLEALRTNYRWASDRMHSFQMDAMAENSCRLAGTGILHYPYVEFEPNSGKGLLHALGARACVIVTDDFPCFFLPGMVAAAARQSSVLLEAVDSNGLLPMRAATQHFSTAHAFRRFLQKKLPEHLCDFPKANPVPDSELSGISAAAVARKIPAEITTRWPRITPELLNGDRSFLGSLPINHQVSPVAARGGTLPAQAALKRFVQNSLGDYPVLRNEPDERSTSELSPYLHFGHLSSHQIFATVTQREDWSLQNLAVHSTGARTGWWGLSEAAETFLDQMVTWRELGFNFCSQRDDYDQYSSLPEWASKTLAYHTRDERARVYTLEQFESAATHDPLWNAAQTQLVQEGRIHNYLRMLWGKKIIERTRTPENALHIMLELNNKYAIDGRDPNSYSGIFWCLGRYDRPWGPTRPIFGSVRYMSSDSAARKLDLKNYLREYSQDRDPIPQAVIHERQLGLPL